MARHQAGRSRFRRATARLLQLRLSVPHFLHCQTHFGILLRHILNVYRSSTRESHDCHSHRMSIRRVSIQSFLYGYVGGWLRGRRQRWVEENFRDCKRVLDIGGVPDTWTGSRFAEDVTLLNVLPKPAICPLPYVQADARSAPFADRTFDLAFSNSASSTQADWPISSDLPAKCCALVDISIARRRIAGFRSNRTTWLCSYTGCRKHGSQLACIAG